MRNRQLFANGLTAAVCLGLMGAVTWVVLNWPKDGGNSGQKEVELTFAVFSDALSGLISQEQRSGQARGADAGYKWRARGSRQGEFSVLYQSKREFPGRIGRLITEGRPSALLVDDALWLGKLNRDWTELAIKADTKFTGTPAPPGSFVPICETRLVLVMSAQRALQFENALRNPPYQESGTVWKHGGTVQPQRTWQLLRDLTRDGWELDPAHKPRIFIANPDHYHSGLSALLLMLAEFRRSGAGSDGGIWKQLEFHSQKAGGDSAIPAIGAFQEFLRPIALASTPGNAGTPLLRKDLQKGGIEVLELRTDDIAIGYEADVLRWVQANSQARLAMVYPHPTLKVTFGGTALNGDWNGPMPTPAAKSLIDRLGSLTPGELGAEFLRPIGGISDGGLPPMFSTEIVAKAGFNPDAENVELVVNGLAVDGKPDPRVRDATCDLAESPLGVVRLSVQLEVLKHLPHFWALSRGEATKGKPRFQGYGKNQ